MAGKGHLIMWNEAVEAEYGPSPSTVSDSTRLPQRYIAAEFDKLLQGYDALSDIPSTLFVPELLETYPHARLVLTTHPRRASGWLRSMGNSYFRISNWGIWSWPLMPYDKAFALPYMTLVRRIMEIWTGTTWPAAGDFASNRLRLEDFYSEHNDKMRALARVSGRELLEFDPRMGWEPLCRFLGRYVPPEGYPHANEGNFVVNIHRLPVLKRSSDVFGATVAKGLNAGAVFWLA